MERHVWGTDWIELQAHLQRQEARLVVARVPQDLVEAFRTISEACWKDLQRSIEASDGEHPGIKLALLEARRSVHRAVNGYLLDNSTQSAEHDEAIRQVATTLKGNRS
jgi:hypothetical protein